MKQPEVGEVLHSLFGKQPMVALKAPEVKAPQAPAKREKRRQQFISNVFSAATAQRFYDPSFHPVTQAETIKQPSPKEVGRGTSNEMSLEGKWGTPPGEGK